MANRDIRVPFLLAETVFLYMDVPLAFSTLYPSPDGPLFNPLYPDLGTNVHWPPTRKF